ncbi:hypothetical protein CBM2634_A10068 [Cupriavidus taiwanensis]|uniref:Uncharacterized protein n=1 Tax=Cupriavidus taiwanensis TaxID=164546 RepID=A0A375ITF7_9BURK|nr:hypothetical protein CBM2634_A10068 [Cupriavidus taiwanensis]
MIPVAGNTARGPVSTCDTEDNNHMSLGPAAARAASAGVAHASLRGWRPRPKESP